MQEAEPKEPQKFFMMNAALITDEELAKRIHEVSDKIYRNTVRGTSRYLFGYPPTVEIKTYDD